MEDHKIETPDKQNAVVLGGMNIKLTLEDPDYAAMTLANYILGGSGGSRLFKRIRDKEGLSYGVSSSVGVPNKDNGAAFRLSSICNPANAPKVEASFRDELAHTVKDGFTAEEVEGAKKSWKESRQVQRSTDQTLLAALLTRERFDRTLKFDEALEAAVSALTPQQVSDGIPQIRGSLRDQLHQGRGLQEGRSAAIAVTQLSKIRAGAGEPLLRPSSTPRCRWFGPESPRAAGSPLSRGMPMESAPRRRAPEYWLPKARSPRHPPFGTRAAVRRRSAND